MRRGTVRSMWSRAGSTAGGNRGRAVDEEGRAGVFFVAVCLGRAGGSRGRGGVPPMKGKAGFIGSTARYEYVHSPGEQKINFLSCHKHPCKMKENAGLYHKQETRVHIPPYEGTTP